MAWKAISGNSPSPLCDLGWKSLGVLELTALPTIQRESWVPGSVRPTPCSSGGDVLYLRHWMQASGLADLLPSLSETVYVGLSAGSIVLTPYNCDAEFNLQFVPEGSDMGEDAGAASGWSISPCACTWIARARRLRGLDDWPRWRSGLRGSRPRHTQSTTRPRSRSRTRPWRSSPRGTGRLLTPNADAA
jgi:hypothetical protein